MMDKQQPPVPAGDYLLYHDGRYVSYGPRVEHHDEVGPPAPGEEPHFWGVYTRNKEDTGWQWYADVSMREFAIEAAYAAMYAVLP